MKFALAILCAALAILAGLLAQSYDAHPERGTLILAFLICAGLIGGLAELLRDAWR